MTERRPKRPWVGRLILRLRRLGSRRREVEDDLQELFDVRARTRSRRYAAARYALDALSLWRWRIGAPATPEGPDLTMRSRVSGWAGVGRDLIFAVRMFTKQPAIVLMTVAGLSLAIGISTVILTLANAATMRSDGIREPDTVYSVEVSNLGRGRLVGGYSPFHGNWAYIDFARLGTGVPSMELAADSSFTTSVEFRQSADRALAETIPAMPISGNYFRVLGGRAALGRTLTPEDDAPGADRLLVVSHVLWKIRFNADPGVVGRTVWLDDVPFMVIGVAEPGFIGAHGSKFQTQPAIWTTFGSQAAVWSARQSAANQQAAAEIARLSVSRHSTALAACASRPCGSRWRLHRIAGTSRWMLPDACDRVRLPPAPTRSSAPWHTRSPPKAAPETRPHGSTRSG